jgi:hypothetical protein
MSMSEPESHPRPLSHREQAVLERLERDLDESAARAERVAMRRFERDMERHDPAFATLLRANADSPAMQSVASATARAWVWILSLLFAVAVGVAATAVVATTLGPSGLAVGGALLLAVFIGLVISVRFS